jgi:hypothetical protein
MMGINKHRLQSLILGRQNFNQGNCPLEGTIGVSFAEERNTPLTPLKGGVAPYEGRNLVRSNYPLATRRFGTTGVLFVL